MCSPVYNNSRYKLPLHIPTRRTYQKHLAQGKLIRIDAWRPMLHFQDPKAPATPLSRKEAPGHWAAGHPASCRRRCQVCRCPGVHRLQASRRRLQSWRRTELMLGAEMHNTGSFCDSGKPKANHDVVWGCDVLGGPTPPSASMSSQLPP